jgi:2-hydroxychromene-2-carboxylate isomerase
MSKSIDFWFSVGSTYTYLSVMRLDEVAGKHGVSFNYRPFSVRVIMVEQNNVPFRGKPVKAAYMWRDIERRASARGVPAMLPAPYPLADFDLANQVAILASKEGWCSVYTKAFYRRWFQGGVDASDAGPLAEIIASIGQDSRRVLDASQTQSIVDAYRAATDEARDLNVFGSPTFVVDGEVFWGDDRLEDAISWGKSGR